MSGAFSSLFSGPLAQAIGWSLLHLVWEATIVAAILAAVLALMTRRSANARYMVSCAALALLPVLALITAVRSYDAPFSGGGQAPSPVLLSSTPITTGEAPVLHLVTTDDATMVQTIAAAARGWLPQIVLLWLAGVTFFSIRLVVSWTRVQKLAREAAQPASVAWQRAVSRLADALQLRRAIALVESAAVEVPTVIGWLRPMILLPASTLSGLTPEQIEMVLAHELAHIRRNDFFVNLMQTLVETLMFYHPAVWWISNRVRDEREHCCDDLAIAVCGNPLQYARALTRLEELRAAQTELAVAANGGSLMTRIRRLVVSQKESTGGGARWAAGAAVLAVIVVLLTLPSLPALAKHDETKDKSKTASKSASKTESAEASKSEIEVHPDSATNESEAESDSGQSTDADVQNDDDDAPGVPAAPPAPEAVPAPAIAVTVPEIHIAPVAVAAAVQAAIAPDPPEPHRMRLRDSHEFGANGKLTVEELIALRSSGITSDYINDMRANSGFSELSLHDLYEMRQQGVGVAYLKQLRDAGVTLRTPRDAVELRVMGVSGDYIAQMKSAGYANLSVRDLTSLRAQGVTPDYIASLSAAGYKNLSVRDLTSLRAMGVTTSFVKALADAGYGNLTAQELVRLAASGVNADFIREMSQYRKK